MTTRALIPNWCSMRAMSAVYCWSSPIRFSSEVSMRSSRSVRTPGREKRVFSLR